MGGDHCFLCRRDHAVSEQSRCSPVKRPSILSEFTIRGPASRNDALFSLFVATMMFFTRVQGSFQLYIQ